MPRCPTYSFREHLRTQTHRPEPLAALPQKMPVTVAIPWAPEDLCGFPKPSSGQVALPPCLLMEPMSPNLAPAPSSPKAPLCQGPAPAFIDDRLMPW